MSLRSLLKHRCTIKRATVTNTNGIPSKAWSTTVALAQPCLVQEKAGAIDRGGGGQALEYDAVGYFPADADLKPRGGDDAPDQITITIPSRAAGTVYLVEHVSDSSGQDRLLNAYLKRYRAG